MRLIWKKSKTNLWKLSFKVSIDSTSSGEVAITQMNQTSDTKLEPIVVPRQITGSDLQGAVTQRF